MIHSKKLTLGICLVLLIILIVGYVIMTKTNGRNAQIKEAFNKTLNMYPTKNLEDFYDKEGFRDQEFDKRDKGTWIINSGMNIQLKGGALKSRAMVLYINRNTRTAKGYFLISETTEDKKGYVHNKDKKYPVKMEHNRIIPTKHIKDEKLKKEIENFKFFVQYGDFKDINDYKDGDISYNPNVPSYSANYQLNNDDYNVQQLRKRYDISTKRSPKLKLRGSGDLKGSSVGSKELEFNFIRNKEENVYFSDSINFKPTE
ncbi:TPA: tandem-type lipoprotein [Staphylococcus aureus]|uniref:tandem-type lipoprotein n=2 Tax=Staphylococcus aureus TaxID=1280 RepID=UPI00085BFE1C|nr:tandem-type lipoprotein [Staphylococcus aureus]EJX2392486.1 tandem-type lipoprotein [Staphylococcus aureus]ELK6029721.1 tandem-type lipoprotein [Staphylococcus aureus]MBG0979463.1 tandem-type lipoprotein [Staphylococcus aureus]MBG1028356.1 tandem-type lipoprotein [Staphylococcus aureus]MCQ1244424.1 tandem-type lipoprotein [Staphylococcus aureus]